MLCVYLGAGGDRIPGFTHVEINVSKHIDKGIKAPEIVADIVRELPLKDHSVNLFYSIHTLEHLRFPEIMLCLKNINRKLVAGGALRIVVPCFDAMISDYLSKEPVEKHLWEVTDEFPINDYVDLFVARVLYPDHFYLLNAHNLRSILHKSGFGQIQTCAPGESNLDNLSEIFKGKETTRPRGDLVMEAFKIREVIDDSGDTFSWRSNLEYFLNLKFSRVNAGVPRFPQRRWFYEKYLRCKKPSLVYFDSSAEKIGN